MNSNFYYVTMFVKSLRIILFLAVILNGLPTFAQQSYDYENPGNKFRTAVMLFEKEKYAAAASLFQQLSRSEALPDGLKADAALYEALCAAELDHPDAPYLVETFIRENPPHAQAKQAYFYLGRMEFARPWRLSVR